MIRRALREAENCHTSAKLRRFTQQRKSLRPAGSYIRGSRPLLAALDLELDILPFPQVVKVQ
jgi:hypothetical protein